MAPKSESSRAIWCSSTAFGIWIQREAKASTPSYDTLSRKMRIARSGCGSGCVTPISSALKSHPMVICPLLLFVPLFMTPPSFVISVCLSSLGIGGAQQRSLVCIHPVVVRRMHSSAVGSSRVSFGLKNRTGEWPYPPADGLCGHAFCESLSDDGAEVFKAIGSRFMRVNEGCWNEAKVQLSLAIPV